MMEGAFQQDTFQTDAFQIETGEEITTILYTIVKGTIRVQ